MRAIWVMDGLVRATAEIDTAEGLGDGWEVVNDEIAAQAVPFATRNEDGSFTAPPADPIRLSKNSFMNLFTSAEWMTIKAARAGSAEVDYWWDQYDTAEYLELPPDGVTAQNAKQTRLINGLAQMVVGGLLTSARRDEILANQTPA